MDNRYEKIYNENYYRHYHLESKSVYYKEYKPLKDFFDNLASQIVKTINPSTVLDVGCAMGFLVASLRDLGVQAYGIDVSEFAIDNVREDIKPYCKVCDARDDLPNGFPRRFDLVVNVEMIEHLYEDDADKVIANICSYTNSVIFSSTDSEINDPTHFNVQPMKYWSKRFSKYKFYRSVEDDMSFVSSQAVLFRKKNATIEELVEDYEYVLNIANKSKEELDISKKILTAKTIEQKGKIDKLSNENDILKIQNESLNYDVEYLEEQTSLQSNELEALTEELSAVIKAHRAVTGSIFWRISLPIRKLTDNLKKFFKKNKATKLIYIGLAILKNEGVKGFTSKFKHWALKSSAAKKYIKNNIPTNKQMKLERETVFKRNVKISILVPLYNTPIDFLKEMIESVINQTYSNWELCMADGSDNEHSKVGEVVRNFANRDKRIKYNKLNNNLGISGNTNKCIEIATGDYIALFDHDDLLHQSALFDVVTAINDDDADFIYTDECSFEGNILNPVSPHFKPDFSPDTLRSYNYICHLSVFSRELLNKTGVFSSNHDGSQDYDMILRLTENAKKIVHIPRILYYWRIHETSVANNIEAKPYCIQSAKNAIKDQLDRLSLKGEVVDSSVITTYKINYKIIGRPLISIIIPNKDHIEDLKKCISSIIDKSSYDNYEIIIVENNSEEERTYSYYKSLKSNKKINVVNYEGDFNYSAINNLGFKHSKGDYILLLNNDVKVINSDWLQEMLIFAQRKDIGAVGAKLLFPDDTIQHAGVILGINGVAGHAHKGWDKDSPGYAARISIAHNVSAVTAACLMMSRNVFLEVGGLDEGFAVAFNDIDLCMRIREAGYLIVYTPYAQLYHYESKSRGYEDTPVKKKRFIGEVVKFQERWNKVLKHGDPYYNRNLTLKSEDFSLKT